jgi:Purine-nucleoside phosphorylase
MKKLADYGVIGTEMESAGLYLLAAKLHFRALSVLTVSDLLFGSQEKQRLLNVKRPLTT